MASEIRSVGFVIDGNLPSFRVNSLMRMGPLSLIRGYRGNTAMGEMRFGWIADEVNSKKEYKLHYELYRPLRRYDLLVFVKSMTPACLELARECGKPALFDINVDYFNVDGVFYYEGMKATPEQQEKAIAMAKACAGVIAASKVIEQSCSNYNPHTICISDNVNLEIVPAKRSVALSGKKLRLLWSGQALKLFDLLCIEDVLRQFRRQLELVLITTDLAALDYICEPYLSRLKNLLSELDCRIIKYESIPHLMNVYAEGGILISPRFLDSSYNRGHTEWKITLGMACGCLAVCSPQQSYLEVAELSGNRGIRICRDTSAWINTIEQMLGGGIDWRDEEAAARDLVAKHYSTQVVAQKHARFVESFFQKG